MVILIKMKRKPNLRCQTPSALRLSGRYCPPVQVFFGKAKEGKMPSKPTKTRDSSIFSMRLLLRYSGLAATSRMQSSATCTDWG